MDEFAMLEAAGEGDLQRVKQLIEGGVSVNSRDVEGQTLLHWAAHDGRYELAELLISSKCDLNPKDRRGRTPVMLAAVRCKKDIVCLLLQHGAQVNCSDDDEWTLLHQASCNNSWTDIVRLILDTEEADLNAATKLGNTPLTWAAMHGHAEVAALLILAGADANRSNAQKRTALHEASWKGHIRVVWVLLEKKGLDLSPQDEHGDTPLHDACQGRHREVIRLLLEAGADPNIKNNKCETALSEGIRREKLTLEEIKLFVQKGAFLENCDYVCISQNPFLKENILKEVGFCTQSIVNKFHNQSLRTLYRNPYFARNLPTVNNFKLNAQQIDEVENLVKCEIERNTFCNVVMVHPMALSALCVLSLITCQSGTKRSASPDFGHSPFKKLQN